MEDNRLKVMAKDVQYNDVKRLTHDDMKNRFLEGDAIDETTRSSVDDFELDRMVASTDNYPNTLNQNRIDHHKI
ncbi:hypothetical protein [Tumebacillus permanentifrigoris]|uniref:Uncharacterized protein n=1 Tax=Tumebacillus permanentifrigoris TaxID=378543 RepID=A0A316DB18_9BACL|nr:hypothetical protein [Tumebacillus permanentifrigoris]PWK13890.1 hypothetical protein C7459_106170 [Tumebacillus permanentifrigoris]